MRKWGKFRIFYRTFANYHFTTLSPNLGVVRYYDDSFVAEDIPGLIEGASDGARAGRNGDDNIFPALSAAKITPAAIAVPRTVFGAEAEFDQIVLILIADEINVAALSADADPPCPRLCAEGTKDQTAHPYFGTQSDRGRRTCGVSERRKEYVALQNFHKNFHLVGERPHVHTQSIAESAQNGKKFYICTRKSSAIF